VGGYGLVKRKSKRKIRIRKMIKSMMKSRN